MEELTWTCMVCGERRPDAMISVHKIARNLEGGISCTTNVRYCNDRVACRDGSPNHSLARDAVQSGWRRFLRGAVGECE